MTNFRYAKYDSAGVAIDDPSVPSSSAAPSTPIGMYIAFVGDSLTEGGRLPLPFLPENLAQHPTLTPTNISSTYLIGYAPLMGVPNGTGLIECNTAGALRFTAFGDLAGPWVSCTVGGIFLLPSGTSAYKAFAQTRWVGHAGVTLPGSTLSDTVAISAFASIQYFNPLGFAAWACWGLQASNVKYWMFATAGDTIEDINARKQRVSQFAIDNGFAWDDIVLLAGANNVGGSVASLASGVLGLADYFASISQRVHVLELFPQGGASTTLVTKKRIIDANRRIADGLSARGPNYISVQTYNRLVDPTSLTGDVTQRGVAKANFEAGATAVHLMPYGAKNIGQQVVNSLRPFYPQNQLVTTSGADTYDATDNVAGNWLSNGKLFGATAGVLGSGAVAPTGWTLSGVGSSIAYVTAATMLGADDGCGDFLELTAPISIVGELTASPTVNAVAGDVFEVSAEVVTRGATGSAGAIVQVNLGGTAAPNSNAGPYIGQCSGSRELIDIVNSGIMRYSQRFVVPTGVGATATFRLRSTASALGTSVAAFRNVVIRKVF